MRYLIKQKLFSLASDFIIKDEDEHDVFIVGGKFFESTLHFKDPTGREIASIEEDTVPWESTFNICRGGEPWAVVQKKLFALFRSKFTIETDHDNVLAEGNFLDYEYVFTRDGRPIAHVSKEWGKLTDSYEVDVEAHDDVLLVLTSTVIIDMCETD